MHGTVQVGGGARAELLVNKLVVMDGVHGKYPVVVNRQAIVDCLFNWYKMLIYTGINRPMDKPTSPTSLTGSTTPTTYRLLGNFIRAHRERLPVAPAGSARRRTPGWRREELADAAGIGVTWLTWLEQGRYVAASASALARLADALRLTPAERASLFDLAGRRDPAAPPSALTDMPPDLLALPAALRVPAYLLDASWNARAWNPAAGALMKGWLDQSGEALNLLRFVFFDPAAQLLIVDWPARARRLVAEFRADFSRRPRDAALLALIEELRARSPLFASCWTDQSVAAREGGERSFAHPELGPLRYAQTTLLVATHPDCKLVCLTPIPSGAEGKG